MRIRRIFPKISLLLVGYALLSLLSGCGDHWRPHTRREVLNFIQAKFPGESITVSKDYNNPIWENGKQSPFRVWDCWFDDLPEVVFHVASSYNTDGPVPYMDYSLRHDRDIVFWSYYLEQYQSEAGSLDLWDATPYASLAFHFSSMTDVSRAAEQLRAFFGWYEAQPHAGQARSANCYLDGLPLPSDNPVTEYIYLHTAAVLAANPNLSFGYDVTDMETQCAYMVKSYYAFYHLPSPDFSEEEITAFAQENWALSWTEGVERSTVPYLRRDGESIPTEFFSGVAVQPYAGSGLEFSYISYGGLFELLTRLDLAPEGGPERFTVTGADGAFYEFSYDLTDTDKNETVWFHTRNGEPVKRSVHGEGFGKPILRVSGEVFQAVTGLEFHKPA